MFIGDWLARREMLTPNKIALIDAQHDYRSITYREWNRSANRTANFLRDLGVCKGDRVAVLAMNGVEYLDVWFACGKLGAIMQTLNWRLTPYELCSLIDDATPIVLIYDSEFEPAVRAIRSQARNLRHFIALDRTTASDDHRFAERETYNDDPPPSIDLDWNDAWVICYTGGTTGLPKGAILTHRSIAANSVNTVMSWGLTPDDV